MSEAPQKGSPADKWPRLYEISRFYLDLSEVLTKAGYSPVEQYIAERIDLGIARESLKQTVEGLDEAKVGALDAELDVWVMQEPKKHRQEMREAEDGQG